MKKWLFVIYLFFIPCFIQASSHNDINFALDGDDKVVSPQAISLWGDEIKCVGKTLEEIFYDISHLQNPIGKRAFAEELSAKKLNKSIDYQVKINEYIQLGTKIGSESAIDGEWLFVFKGVYETMLQDKNSLSVTVYSTENKIIGPQSKTILDQSVASGKSYVDYLTALLQAVTPAKINQTGDVVTSPSLITINKQEVGIQGKSAQDLFDIVMSESMLNSKLITIKKLTSALQPEAVKRSFIALYTEHDYCAAQKIKIQDAINLFSQHAKKIIQPQSFGRGWLKKASEFIGTDKDIVISSVDDEWNKNINNLKGCFALKIDNTNVYRIVPYKKTGDTVSFQEETALLFEKSLHDKVDAIIESMKRQFDLIQNKFKDFNLYPAPLDAFNLAWNSLYVFDEKTDTYMYMSPKDGLKQIEDSENVELVKQALLQNFAGMDYGSIKKSVGSSDTSSQEQSSGSDEKLPEEIATILKKYFDTNNLAIKEITMLKAWNESKSAMPEGWSLKGPSGIVSPSGNLISMDKVVKSVKATGGDNNDASGAALGQSDYNAMQKHIQGTPAHKDDSLLMTALRSGKTYKQYLDLLAGGNQSIKNNSISEQDYETMLALANKAQVKKKLPLAQLTIALTVGDPTKTYANLGLPSEREFKDLLFTALGKGLTYDQFIASQEYVAYAQEHNIQDQEQEAVPADQEEKLASADVAVVASQPLVDEKRYSELVDKFIPMFMRPNFNVKTVKMQLGSIDSMGRTDEELSQDKDKLAQALFEKKTYEQYLELLGISVKKKVEPLTQSNSNPFAQDDKDGVNVPINFGSSDKQPDKKRGKAVDSQTYTFPSKAPTDSDIQRVKEIMNGFAISIKTSKLLEYLIVAHQ